ncbi:High mobility group B protein 13 [Camellia lanceoleosa]|uniref:High mobility group B protein 13 n=1 Tax=Camellia lanceoleosa TaxID=1840588 RepID=A0ACC0ID65_9ERIC|nr:High mobility group B protein 13 [Camellia lanceoleosa]
MSAFFMFTNERRVVLLTESKSVREIAKQNKEKYLEEMGTYKKRKKEESANLKKDEDEMMKIHKQEALQLLKKKEKTDNIIKELSEEDKQTWNEKAVKAKEPRWNWKSTTNLQQWRRKTTTTHNSKSRLEY